MNNALFYGDNLRILREYITDESVNLIYLDPPFNSNRSYNVLFKDESGKEADAQITAFDDSWHWGETAEQTFSELLEAENPTIALMISAMRQFVGTNQMMMSHCGLEFPLSSRINPSLTAYLLGIYFFKNRLRIPS